MRSGRARRARRTGGRDIKSLRILGLLALAVLGACVTINVYFPAAAVERAADRIIDEVWQESIEREGGPPPAKPSSALPLTRRVALLLLDALVPAAAAQQPDIDLSSPAIERLKSSMTTRHERLAPLYDSGAIGLTADGLVAVRDARAVPLRDRATVNQLVAEENRDRDALYREIARANGHPEWEVDVRQTFARRWVEKAPAGWWYRLAGEWRRK